MKLQDEMHRTDHRNNTTETLCLGDVWTLLNLDCSFLVWDLKNAFVGYVVVTQRVNRYEKEN